MTLGSTLRRLREQKGWTQGQLAIKSGVGQSHISQIERGGSQKVSAEVLSKVARELDVSVDYLCREAGWLHHRPLATEPGSAEQQLIDIIRSVPTERIRTTLLEQFTWVAGVARDADLARQPGLRLVAEKGPEYPVED